MLAILPSNFMYLAFRKSYTKKIGDHPFVLSFIGSMLGMILQLVMYTKTIISTEHQVVHKPSLYVSKILLEYWSLEVLCPVCLYQLLSYICRICSTMIKIWIHPVDKIHKKETLCFAESSNNKEWFILMFLFILLFIRFIVSTV